jgi:FixJ family two-component response regulator
MHGNSESATLRLLFVEDDEDDYILIRDMLSDVLHNYKIDWINTYDHALAAIQEDHECKYDVYIIDYQLDQNTGLDLVYELRNIGCQAPIILLTGHADYEVDLMAMKAGLSDYLDKSEITPRLLERSIRYSIERKHSETELREYKESLEILVKERTMELEKERDRLQEALANIKTLEGLLPICAWCRKIRNDQGYWMQLEEYFLKHSDLQFSHGICPECMKEVSLKMGKTP